MAYGCSMDFYKIYHLALTNRDQSTKVVTILWVIPLTYMQKPTLNATGSD